MKLAVILFKTNTLASGEHPLMLRISQQQYRKYVALGLSCHPHLWDEKKNLPRKKHPNRDYLEAIIAHKLAAYHAKMLEMRAEDLPLTPQTLARAVEAPRQARELFPFLEELVERFERSGQVGNARVYMDMKRSINQFHKGASLLFSEIDLRWLNQYEVFLRSKGLVDTSISVYFRTLRAVFNKAIQEGLVKETLYPFKTFNVSKFNTSTQKRAITKEEMMRIADLTLEPDSPLWEARNFFLLSYYGQGINFRDMALLCWKNVVEGRVFYRRAKTKKQLQFKLLPQAEAIIEAYRPPRDQHPEQYVFPILCKKTHLTPQQMENRLDKVLKRTNLALKEIAAMAGIKTHLTMYVARHTYATVLKRSGVAIPVISEAMGHATPMVTQTYLKSFEDEVIDEANTFLV